MSKGKQGPGQPRKELNYETKRTTLWICLFQAKTLRIHSLLCNCSLCKPDDEDQVSLFVRQCPHSAPSFIKQHDGRVFSDIK